MNWVVHAMLDVEAALYEWYRARRRDFVLLPVWAQWVLPVSVVLLVVAVVALPWGWGAFKRYRSEEMLASAREHHQDGDPATAFEAAQTALVLNPANDAAVVFLADLADELGSPNVVTWRTEQARREGFTPEALLAIAEHALRFGAGWRAAPLLLYLDEATVDPLRLARARAALHMMERNGAAARREVARAWSLAPEDPLTHALLARLVASGEAGELAGEAGAAWERLSVRGDALGRLALKGLIQRGSEDPKRLRAHWERLEHHPKATQADRLAAAAWMLENGHRQWERVRAELQPTGSDRTDAEWLQWVRWLEHLGRSEAVVGALKDDFHRHGTLARAYIVALLDQGDAARAQEVLDTHSRHQLHLSEGEYAYLEALVQQREAAALSGYQLQEALRQAEGGDWQWIEQDVLRRSDTEAFSALLEQQSRAEDRFARNNATLLTLAYYSGDETRVRRLLSRNPLASFAGADGGVAWFAAYLRWVLEIDTEGLRGAIAELSTRWEAPPAYHNLLGLIYAANGRAEAAASVAVAVAGGRKAVPVDQQMLACLLQAECFGVRPPEGVLTFLESAVRLDAERERLAALRGLPSAESPTP